MTEPPGKNPPGNCTNPRSHTSPPLAAAAAVLASCALLLIAGCATALPPSQPGGPPPGSGEQAGVGVTGSLFGQVFANADAYCDGSGYSEYVRNSERFDGVQVVDETVAAAAEMTKPDGSGGAAHESSGSSSATLSVSTTTDGSGRVTAVTGSGHGSAEGQASNALSECYVTVSSGSSHVLSGTDYLVIEEPVIADLDVTVRFDREESSGSGLYNFAAVNVNDYSTTTDPLNVTFDSDGQVSERILLEPGEYSILLKIEAKWDSPYSCDDCAATTGYSFDYTLSFERPDG